MNAILIPLIIAVSAIFLGLIYYVFGYATHVKPDSRILNDRAREAAQPQPLHRGYSQREWDQYLNTVSLLPHEQQ
jgi:hypothetical protein